MTHIVPAPPEVDTRIINHKPIVVSESSSCIIIDDFLPEDVYEKISLFAVTTDYKRINTEGKTSRAWHIHDGFPLRSMCNLFCYANETTKPCRNDVWPTNSNELDHFVSYVLNAQIHVEKITGKKEIDWEYFSVTAWIYPHATSLSMHEDGAGVYSGAYVYFINPIWRPHWGGLLIVADEKSSRNVYDYVKNQDPVEFHRTKWLHANKQDELLMETGLAQCIFPKKNRIVFIANSVYHMVTRINEQAGDNVRMSLAGFFHKWQK